MGNPIVIETTAYSVPFALGAQNANQLIPDSILTVNGNRIRVTLLDNVGAPFDESLCDGNSRLPNSLELKTILQDPVMILLDYGDGTSTFWTSDETRISSSGGVVPDTQLGTTYFICVIDE